MPVNPAYTAGNVLTGQAAMYLQAFNPAVPASLPANTVLLGGAWGGSWTAVGATMQGLAFKFQRNVQDIMIEEQDVPVDKRTKDSKFTMDVELSEDTFQSMLYAYGGGVITTTAAVSGVPGTQTLAISTELTYFAFGFEGQNELGYYRRVLVPKVASVANANTDYRRADKQRTYAVSFESLVPLAQVTFRQMNAAALP